MKSVGDAREIRHSLLSAYENVEDGLLPLETLNVVIVGVTLRTWNRQNAL
jgi:NADH dehydrogenase FAD-containing subunit